MGAVILFLGPALAIFDFGRHGYRYTFIPWSVFLHFNRPLQ